MQADEIRELSDDEIRTRVAELEEERFRLKFRSATEALDDPLRFRVLRRDIARMKTVLRERALRGESKQAPAAGKKPARGRKKTTSRAAR